MPMRVHVVRGDTGDYSSFRTWEVKAFRDEEKAKALCAELNAWCTANTCHREQERERGRILYSNDMEAYRRMNPKACPLDPSFEIDTTGTQYEVWSIDVEDMP